MNCVLLEKIERLIQNPLEAKSEKEQPVTGKPHIHVEWEIKFFADRVLLVPPRTVHSISTDSDGLWGALLIGEDSLIAPMDSDGIRLVRIRRDEKSPAFEKLLDALIALPEEESECRCMLSRTFFRLLKKTLESGWQTAAEPDPVQEAAVFLEKYYYRSDLSVEEIAARMGYTQQYLNRKFKSYSGCSILQELMRIRLRHARELLLAGNYLISDVARLTGWRNAFYFSRVYRRFYGYPPRDTVSRG